MCKSRITFSSAVESVVVVSSGVSSIGVTSLSGAVGIEGGGSGFVSGTVKPSYWDALSSSLHT